MITDAKETHLRGALIVTNSEGLFDLLGQDLDRVRFVVERYSVRRHPLPAHVRPKERVRGQLLLLVAGAHHDIRAQPRSPEQGGHSRRVSEGVDVVSDARDTSEGPMKVTLAQ